MRNQLLPKVGPLKACLFLFAFMSLFWQSGHSQVSVYYRFSQTSGTYTPITGTNVFSGTFDDGVSSAVTIPRFNYNGTNVTRMFIGANGWVAFRATGTAGATATPLSSTNTASGYIAPMGADLVNASSGTPTVSWAVVGTEVVVQWKDVGRYTLAANTEKFSFQLHLDTVSGVIRFIYDAVSGVAYTTAYPQIGLRGSDPTFPTNINNRELTTVSAWTSTNGGTSNTSTVAFIDSTSTIAVPTSGLIFQYTPATCFPPTGITASAITQTSANLSWTAPTSGTPAGYAWEVVASGAGPYATPIAGNIGTGTTASTGSVLQANTVYDVYVKTGCNIANPADSSVWSAVYSFRTACAPVSALPYLETFDNASLASDCWSASAGSGATIQWLRGTGVVDSTHGIRGPQSGAGFAYLNVFNASTTYNPYLLTSPTFTLPAAAQQVSYYYFIGNAGNTTAPLALQISTDNGATWTTIYTHTSANSILTSNNNLSDWHQNIVAIPTYTNVTAIFRFAGTSNFGSNRCNMAVDEFSITALPSCPPPTGVTASAITATSATLSWTAPSTGTPDNYTWKVVASGSGPYATAVATGNIPATGTTTPTGTVLNGNTTYDVYVKTGCSASNPADTSGWSAAYTFTTLCGVVTVLPYTESFNNSLTADCWSATSGSGASIFWQTGTGVVDSTHGISGPQSSVGFAYLNVYSGQTAYNPYVMTSPAIALPAAVQQVSYYYFLGNAGNTTSPLVLQISTDNGATWTALYTHTSANSILTSNNNISDWHQNTVILPSYTNVTAKFRFVGTSNWGSNRCNMAVDEFSITAAPNCAPPTGVTASNITATSADITWTAPATGTPAGYAYEVVASGAGPYATPIVSNVVAAPTTTASTGTVLTGNTTYDVYVKTGCSLTNLADTSTWSPVYSFTTLCGVVTALPYTESFSNPTLGADCWTAASGSGASIFWQTGTGVVDSTHGIRGPQSSVGFAYLNVYSGQTAYNPYTMTSPSIALPAAPQQVSYYYFLGDAGNTTSPLVLQVSTDNGATWTPIYTHTPANSVFTSDNNISDWHLNTVILGAYINTTAKFRFVGTSNWGSNRCNMAVDEFTITAAPNCLAPNGLTISPTTNSATIRWNTSAGSLPAGYQYVLVDSGAAPTATAVSAGYVATPDTFATASGLAANTYYSVYVRSVCSAGDTSAWTAVSTFLTPCVNAGLPLIEGFNSTSRPSCWTEQQVVGNTTLLQYVPASLNPTVAPQEGSDFVLFNSYAFPNSAGVESRLVSPPITSTGIPSVDISFYWFNENNTDYSAGAYLNEGVTAQYSLDGITWTDAQFFPRQDNTIASGTGRWNQKFLTLPAAVGNQPTFYVGFKFHSEWGDNCEFDNLHIFASSACAGGPSALTAVATSTSTAALSWVASATPPANGYNWVVVASGDSATGTVISSGTTAAGVTSATATGLSANTPYDIFVQSNCGGGNGTGFWIGPVGFSTPCAAITSLPWTEGFEGLGGNVGYDLFPSCWLATPTGRWGTTNAPLGFPANITSRSGTNYVVGFYDAADTLYTPSFTLTGGQPYEFYFYYQTDGDNGWDTIEAVMGTAQTPGAITRVVGTPVLDATNLDYVKYSGIFTPATSGDYFFGVHLVSEFAPNNVAFDDFGLQAVVPCPNPPRAGTIAGPSSVCPGTQVNLSLTGYSPYTTLQWQTSTDSITFTDLVDTFDFFQETVNAVTYYRVKVKCADSTYTPVFAIHINAAIDCYCTAGLGGSCGGNNIDTALIQGTNFFVNYTACNTTANFDAYTSFPQTGDSTTTLQRGGSYVVYLHTTGSSITGVWIDFNQDGLYDQANEFVQPYTTGVRGQVAISVPAGATLGVTGMRIRSRASGNPLNLSSACTNFGTGETFDFKITIGDTVCSHPPVVTSTVTDATCFGTATGTVSLTLTGTAPFVHHWSTGDSTSTVTGLAAGTYTDTINFAGGCTYVYPVTVGQATLLVGRTDSIIPVKCFGGNNGAVYVSVSGGTSPYSHHWNTGSTSTPLTGVAIGAYTDTITDAHGCKAILGPDTVRQPTAALAIAIDSTHGVKCNGQSNGAIYTTATGGTAPYTYLWNNAAASTTDDISGLAIGAYAVVVTDNNGCTATATDTVKQPTVLAVTTDSITNVKCNGASTGSIYVSVTGGTSPYTYLWTGGSTTQGLFFKPAGVYAFTATDKNGCTATVTDTIKQPASGLAVTSTTTDTLQGGAAGTITLSVSGGTPAYGYSWSNGANTATLTHLPAGVYVVTVTDANGCATTHRDTVDLVLGLNDLTGDITNFSVYPNPSTGIFNIMVEMSRSIPVEIEVYTVTGQKVEVTPKNIANHTFQVDLGTDAAGVYVVKVKAGDSTMTRRLTVVK